MPRRARLEPRVALDYRLSRGIFFALNVEFFARTYNQNLDFDLTRVPSRLTYGVGAFVPIAAGVGVGAEIAGAVGISKLSGGALYAPAEAYLTAEALADRIPVDRFIEDSFQLG